MEAFKHILLLSFAFSIIIPTSRANIVEFDEYWQKRAEKAQKNAQDAYQENPDEVAAHFNEKVHKSLDGYNDTRRNLGKYTGPCQATNPIDQCWRCDPHWADNRKKLANCALGFGRKTTGGKDGEFYVVTDPSDDDVVNPKPGTLRYGVIQDKPLWITFAHNMKIKLKQELLVTSNKTIDGRGANVHIAEGAQVTLQFVRNVIIHGLHIHDNIRKGGGLIRDSVNHFGHRTISDGDGISIFGSTNIWIDHVSMSNCYDGLVDAVTGSTAITVSNCHMTRHNEAMLFGASDAFKGDSMMQITVAFNHFGRGLTQRLPRVRWGYVHIVNNDYTQWEMYAIGGSSQPTILSQGNRFVAPPNRACKEVTKRDYAPKSVWKSWNWKSQGDLFENGAFFVQSGDPNKKTNYDGITAKPGSYASLLTKYAGALDCHANKPC